jgi:hypothetical protein
MIEAYKKYHSAGFACVPTGKNKAPAVPKGAKITGNWDQLTEYESAHGIGLICGNGLECIDFDNHFNDAKQRFEDFILNPDVAGIYEQNKFCVQQTVNNGFHIIYRTPAVNGSDKLAERLNDKGKKEALIETRGTGNYFCCDPTPGYRIIWNDILDLPTIATEDRDILLEACRSYNEVTTIKKEPEERIGDIFNRSPEALREMTEALEGAGWTEVEQNRWRRPGKDRGISATLNVVAPGLFYNFSANGDPFEMNSTYSPFQVVSLLKYHGDNKAFARELHERYTPPEEKSATMGATPAPAMAELEKRLSIDLTKEPEAAPAILYYQHIPIACLQDFTLITGKAKVRKTFLAVFLTASYLGYKNDLIFNDPARPGTVLWFDTEQSPHYFFKTLKRVCRMTQDTPRLKGYTLKTLTPGQKTDFIEYVVKTTPNVKLVIIDGIRDLVFDINSPEEATKTSVRLMQWCAENNLHIICILHQNKADGNARGHLGTELVNKAQTVLSVSLEAGNKTVSSVEGEYTRDLEFPSFSFIINEDSLPELCNTTPSEDKTIKRTDPKFISAEVHWKALNVVFRERQEQKYTEVCMNIKLEFAQNNVFFGENKAKEYLAYYIKQGWISKNHESKTYMQTQTSSWFN